MSASAAMSGALPSTSARASAVSRRVPRGRALLAGLLLTGGLLAGCGGGEPTLPEATRTPDPAVGAVTTAPDGVQEVVLETGDDYVFTPAAFTVAPGPVRVTVRNVAEQMTHNFEFTPDAGPSAVAEAIPYLAPGDSDTVEFTVSVPGDYPFECSFHIAQGQVGTMTVTEG